MRLLHEPEDPFIQETLFSLARNALETIQANTRIAFGQVTGLSCTANTLKGQTVSFMDAQGKNQLSFLKGTTPFVIAGISSLGNTASQVTVSAVSASNTSFTLQVYSSVTQTVSIVWFAIGQVGG